MFLLFKLLQQLLSVNRAVLRRPAEPVDSLFLVLLHTCPTAIAVSQLILRFRVVLLRRLPEPVDGLHFILLHAETS